jgi:hypothetical protein
MHDAAVLTVVAATVAGWRRDDKAGVLTRVSEEKTAATLDAIAPRKARAEASL